MCCLDVSVKFSTSDLSFVVDFSSRGLIVAMILSWLFLILMRFIAGFLFWFFMFGVLGILAYGRYHST